MNTAWLLTNTAAALLLPPLSLVILCAAGWFMRGRRPRLGGLVIFLSAFFLLSLSTQAGAKWLASSLESPALAISDAPSQPAQAIVILGGGRMKNAPEYAGGEIVSFNTLARLRYGARLYRKSGLPILVTGGKPDGGGEPEAVLMARVLQEDFSVPVRWIEPASRHTAENAAFSANLLKQAGIRQILLVTDALHMTRAQAIFAQHGLQVVPAPTGFISTAPSSPADYIPKAGALASSYYALHEWMGLAWYRLRY